MKKLSSFETPTGNLTTSTSLRDNVVIRNLIMAVFSDCRELYPSRRMFDQDRKALQNATLGNLYDAWKQVNASLCKGDVAKCDLLLWHPTTPKGVRGIRQVVGLLSRLEGVAPAETAIEGFATRVSGCRSRISDKEVLQRARHIVQSLLGAPPSIWDLHPKHGSGAVATGERNWEKWNFSVTYRQLEYHVKGSDTRPTPLSADLFHANPSVWSANRHVCSIEKHPITKVVAVPKDLMRVRIISEEPLSLMFLQQGLMNWLYRTIEARTDAINFTDQTVNAQTCRHWNQWASLDLSDASDLVSRHIVRQLVSDEWWALLTALRSHFAKLPDGRLIPIRAFAPMGSALCFPIESLTFYASVRAYLEVRWMISDVFVYGDDMVVPVAYAEEVIQFLQDIGMVPNVQKCCYLSSFRESCGAEWFQGEDVTVLRPKSLNAARASRERSDRYGESLPLVDHANQAYNIGFPRLAQALADLVLFPVSPGEGPGYANPRLHWKVQGQIRYSADYQCYMQRVACFGKARCESPINGWSALEAFLTNGWSSRRPTQVAPVLRFRWLPLRP